MQDNNVTPISLFSFQDIITSITGIMFLVVLMLILALLDNDSAKPEAVTPETAALHQQVALLREEFAALTAINEETQKRIAEYMKLDPTAIEDAINRKMKEAAVLNVSLAALTEKIRTQRDNIRKLDDDTLKQTRTMEELTRKRDEESRKLQSLQQELADAKRDRNIIPYTIDATSQKKPVIVDCSATSLKVCEHATGKVIGFAKGDAQSSINAFMRWLASHNKNDTYVTLLLRPAAFTYGQAFSSLIRSAGFRRGTEVIPDNDSVIFK